jgi:hypothetical protein
LSPLCGSIISLGIAVFRFVNAKTREQRYAGNRVPPQAVAAPFDEATVTRLRGTKSAKIKAPHRDLDFKSCIRR